MFFFSNSQQSENKRGVCESRSNIDKLKRYRKICSTFPDFEIGSLVTYREDLYDLIGKNYRYGIVVNKRPSSYLTEYGGGNLGVYGNIFLAVPTSKQKGVRIIPTDSRLYQLESTDPEEYDAKLTEKGEKLPYVLKKFITDKYLLENPKPGDIVRLRYGLVSDEPRTCSVVVEKDIDYMNKFIVLEVKADDEVIIAGFIDGIIREIKVKFYDLVKLQSADDTE